MMAIAGFKNESDVRQPVESPDSLHSQSTAKVLDIVGEGPILGLVDGLRSVYYNETPVINADGTSNFPGAAIEVRLGTQDQAYIKGMPSVDNETYAGVELKFGQPWSQGLTNLSLSAVRVRLSVAGLIQQLSNGDRVGWRIEYAVQLSTDGSDFVTVFDEAFDGKTTQKYERSRRVDLPSAKLGWTLRVVRKTPAPSTDLIAGKMVVESFTEVIDAKLRYPMSALVFSTFPAAQFGTSIPKRGFEIYGRVVSVPDNYDPWTRQYAGMWTGAFKLAWTNNPAWIFYDLVLSRRYGLGRYISPDQLDKWELYTIGRYCDELVPDGKGGTEPRFTCNVVLQKRSQARKVIQDLASLFRGIAYMAGGSVYVSADMPRDASYVFNASNVEGGKFRYAGTPRKTRFTAALVSWSDQSDFGRQKVEYVEDRDGIQRYGLQITEMVAFGCTSQGQAQRAGRWALLTSMLERGTATFDVGLDGLRALPGDVVRVYDRKRAGRMNDGRVSQANGRTITLDREPFASAGDQITINMGSGQSASRTIELVSGRFVTVRDDWPEPVAPHAAWVIETSELTAPLYRVLTIKEKRTDTKLSFEVTAVQHEPGKFEAIDHQTRIETRPTVIVPPSVQPKPASVGLSTYYMIDQGISITTLVGEWPAVENAILYDVAWRRDNGDWVTVPRTGSTRVEVRGIYAGTYVMRVRAVNALGVMSAATYSPATPLEGKTSPPPVVTTLTTSPLVMGIALAWGFPDGPLDVERTEIWYAITADVKAAIKLGDFAYPQKTHQLMGLASTQKFYFWARLVDRSGNVGSFFPSFGGVLGQADSNPETLLDYVKGKIDGSALGKELAGRIDLIDGPPAMPGSVNQRLQGVLTDVEGLSTALVEERNQRVSAVEAVSEKVDGVFAQFNPPMAGATDWMAGSTKVMAGVWSEQAARATEDMAVARRVDNVQASVGQNSAAIQQVSQAQVALDGKLSVLYTVKMNVNSNGVPYAAGFALGIENNEGTPVSQFLIQADRFALMNASNGKVSIPFAIQNGETIINTALIGKATLGSAVFTDWLESDARNALGQPLLRLNFRSGEIQFNPMNAEGRRFALNSNGATLYFPNGNINVQFGWW